MVSFSPNDNDGEMSFVKSLLVDSDKLQVVNLVKRV